MADDIHEFEKLLKQVVKRIKELDEAINESPMKGFEEIVKIREKIYRLGELNRNDRLFDQKKGMEELIVILRKFLKFSSKIMNEEGTVSQELLSNVEVQEVFSGLHKRYRTLKGE